MAIRYYLQENQLPQTTVLTGKVACGELIDEKRLVNDIEQMGTTVTRSDVIAVLTALEQCVTYHLDQGHRVSIANLVELYPVIEGAFEHFQEKYDANKHRYKIKARIKKKLNKRFYHKRGFERVRTPSHVPAIEEVRHAAPGLEANRFTPGEMVIVSGRYLKYHRQEADEGWFLVNRSTRQETKVEVVSLNQPSRSILLMPQVAAGDYDLHIRKRHRQARLLKRGVSATFSIKRE